MEAIPLSWTPFGLTHFQPGRKAAASCCPALGLLFSTGASDTPWCPMPPPAPVAPSQTYLNVHPHSRASLSLTHALPSVGDSKTLPVKWRLMTNLTRKRKNAATVFKSNFVFLFFCALQAVCVFKGIWDQTRPKGRNLLFYLLLYLFVELECKC